MKSVYIGVFGICAVLLKILVGRNNVCDNYFDYFFSGVSDKCFYDKYLFSDQVQILERVFPNYETHEVTTEDGYILTMYRLPKKNPKGIVILQHPVTSNSIIYYIQGNQSTAILFHNAGYEVWLPNNRGTPGSQQHVNMTVDEYKYWDFSFHEIGLYDYPAIIKYISNETKRSDITFVGHSMSTTASIIYASMKPEEAKKYIKIFIQMSPTAYFYNIETPAKLFCPYVDQIEAAWKNLEWGSTCGKGSSYKMAVQSGAYSWIPFKALYIFTIQYLMGWSAEPVEPLLATRIFSNALQDSPLKTVIHYGQICKNGGTFRMFDYKTEKNIQLYNSSIPPEYPLENIQVPMYLIPGEDDNCATVKDSEYLYSKLPKGMAYGNYTAPKLNHIAFHSSVHRFSMYQHIIDLLSTLYK